MTKKLFVFVFIDVFIYACGIPKIVHTDIELKPVIEVTADAETNPVNSADDAADDICIWIHPENILQSTIIGTNKKEGLDVYTIDGEKLFSYKIGRINNVDIRNGFLFENEEISIITATNRTNNTIMVFKVHLNGSLEEIGAIASTLTEVYGLGMYKSHLTNKFYTFIASKRGRIEQWELQEKNGRVSGTLVRYFQVGSKSEGIVADDFYGKVYIGEEDKALWQYNAEPNGSFSRVQIISTSDFNMKDDFEGVTLYDKGDGQGYIILSSQGNNSYAVFDRISNQYLGSFKISDGNIDGTTDTDGIDVTSVSFGDKYPNGFFVAQDYENLQGKDTLNQNFKIVDWRKIADKLQVNN